MVSEEHPICIAVAHLGGTATWAQLRSEFSAHTIRQAVVDGLLVRAGRDCYVLPGLDLARREAARLGGVTSHRSAALLHGWGCWTSPRRPEVVVPRGRNLDISRRRGADVRYRDLEPGDAPDGITTPLRTVIDCARDLPIEEGLAVADSALRAGDVTREELDLAVVPRVARAKALLVLGLATGSSANPFESALRGITVEAVGAIFVPQVWIRVAGNDIRPDPVCEELRLAIEADSFEFHTDRSQIASDCWRYDELLLDDWLPLRFAWDHVMWNRPWVARTVVRGVERQRRLWAA